MLEVSLKVWMEDVRKSNSYESKEDLSKTPVDLNSQIFWQKLGKIECSGANDPSLLEVVYVLRNEHCIPSENSLSKEMFFWSQLSDEQDLALAFYADCQFRIGLQEDGIVSLIRLFQRKPAWAQLASFEDLKAKQKGQEKLVLDIRLARLRSCLASNKELDDRIREDYSSLLDEYADRPQLLSKVKSLSGEIVKAENEGRLPRAFVRRTVT